MKREYRTPVAKYVNYAYEEQVVATSAGNKVDTFGDGWEIQYCTYMSDVIGAGCTTMHNSTVTNFKCDVSAGWSLRP